MSLLPGGNWWRNCRGFKMRLFLFVLFLFPLLCAKGQDSLQVFELSEITITGQVEPQSVKKSVYNVRTIPMERLRSQGATRLQDVLNTELNVRFDQDLAVGGSNLSMLGLPGQNVKVLIDGVPVVGRQGTGNEININQINVNTIERIEIVEGPMAVIYGADALAGVINIITKKNVDETLEVSATVHEETAGNEYGFSEGIHNQNINLAYRMKSFYVNGNVSRNDFRGWKGDSTGRETEWHPKRQWLAGGVLGFERDGLHAYYRADYLHEKIYNPAQFSGNEAIDQNYITQRLMHQLQVSKAFSQRLSFNAAAGYSGYERRTQTVAVDRQSGRETLASAALQTSDEFTGMTLRGSLNYRLSDAFSLQPGFDINSESGKGTRLKEDSNSISDYAGFLSADLKLGMISLRPGIRFVHNSVYNAPPVIPSLNSKIRLSDRHDVRLSYGRGFRAPSLRELYFNFFDASHAIEGNENLEAELSHSVNTSWNGRLVINDDWNLTTVLSAFYNDVDNLIDYGIRPGSNVTTYINVSRFKSKGVTLSGTLRSAGTEARIGFAYTGRYNSYMEEDDSLPQFIWSPEVNASLTHHFTETFNASLYYKYTGKTPAYMVDSSDNSVVLTETAGYHWADVTAQKSLGKFLSVSAGIRNLFNVSRIRNGAAGGSAHSSSGSTRPVAYGRSFFVSLTARISK